MKLRSTSSGSRPRTARRITLLSAIALGSLAAASAQASEKVVRTPEGDVTVLTATSAAQQKIPASAAAHPFATEKQRAAATPLQWTEADDLGPKPEAEAALPAPRRPFLDTSAAGGNALPFAEYQARQQFGDAWRKIEALQGRDIELPSKQSGDKDGAHHPYVRYPGNYYTFQWTAAPWNKIGKLYFTTPSGGSSYCTANVASGNSVIITAAHCVYTRGQGFNRNFVFVPAERYGVAPYGRYGWQSATVLSNWISNGGRRWDVAVIKLAGEATTGQPVTNYVGWLGRSWDWGYSQYTYSHGYASNLSTQYTHICAGQTYSSSWEGTDVLVQGCDM
ncbi:MAG: trypsin-like serine protease, partial [Luteimonas sp.]|nr:trypsin-like serine protease [Luteimonas sp.]